MFRNALKPGDLVPNSSVYWVHHYQHRLPHLARTRLQVFPPCAQCGNRVRFEPAAVDADPKAVWLRDDIDFRDAVLQKSG